MTPTEFKSRYIASLPEVPDELRVELDLERFVAFDADTLTDLSLASADAAILSDVGLPNSASPWLNFEIDPNRRLKPIDSFPQMVAIGSNAYGDYVCLDLDANAAVVYVNHDDSNARVLINSSVSNLAKSLCIYLTHRHEGDPADLLSAIGSFDPDATLPGTFWHHESRALTDGGG
ncbi:SUKH-4 family immunity protein [Novipirellula caenicola]|uniref:SMI1 / KNR4 family protein n=1 Tax=Novipirellula caenicola TaxID=1536901 RepID=A0ABP9W543_9BACT